LPKRGFSSTPKKKSIKKETNGDRGFLFISTTLAITRSAQSSTIEDRQHRDYLGSADVICKGASEVEEEGGGDAPVRRPESQRPKMVHDKHRVEYAEPPCHYNMKMMRRTRGSREAEMKGVPRKAALRSRKMRRLGRV